ncbi:Crp/Fnr family transcriptional regulator [Lentzea sp. JNUCC 0626]|uniref:Crp/Fnr family transcriptional regulator n=1 Tax=Lentzea sp. JNUCC 0626 TaxID=3367513 RepID=UPI003747B01E
MANDVHAGLPAGEGSGHLRTPELDIVTREQRADSFWCRLTQPERTMIASAGKEVLIDRKQAVIKAAARRSEVMVLLSGRVRVMSEDGERVIAVRGSGDIIGELAFLDKGVRSATVMAATKVRALVLTREKFDDVISVRPGVLRLLSAVVSTRLRESDANLLERGGGAAAKVTRFLFEHATVHPVVYIGSQAELAKELEISRSSVGRALAQLKRNNLVSVDRSRISIRDLGELGKQVVP